MIFSNIRTRGFPNLLAITLSLKTPLIPILVQAAVNLIITMTVLLSLKTLRRPQL